MIQFNNLLVTMYLLVFFTSMRFLHTYPCSRYLACDCVAWQNRNVSHEPAPSFFMVEYRGGTLYQTSLHVTFWNTVILKSHKISLPDSGLPWSFKICRINSPTRQLLWWRRVWRFWISKPSRSWRTFTKEACCYRSNRHCKSISRYV
jgi:hypothetical protein